MCVCACEGALAALGRNINLPADTKPFIIKYWMFARPCYTGDCDGNGKRSPALAVIMVRRDVATLAGTHTHTRKHPHACTKARSITYSISASDIFASTPERPPSLPTNHPQDAHPPPHGFELAHRMSSNVSAPHTCDYHMCRMCVCVTKWLT